MDSNTNRIISAILQGRQQATPTYLVGGPVRDALLGRPCDDWDMVCRGAKPLAQTVAKKLRAKFITLDENHRIYRVILPDAFRPVRTLDFAELQGRTIEEDLARRDFTINAMAMPLSRASAALPHRRGTGALKEIVEAPVSRRERVGEREIIDPFDGQRDLKRKLIRAVSEKAFKEDPLRLIRAFRFAAQLEMKIEPRTLKMIHKHCKKLSGVAAERIREELLRLWKQPHSISALRLADTAGLLRVIFPEIEACRRTAIRYYGRGGVLKHSFETIENLEWILKQIQLSFLRKQESNPKALDPGFRRGDIKNYLDAPIGAYPRTAWLKWAAFLHDVGKPATAKVMKGRLRFFEHEHVGATIAARIAQRLRCSRQEAHLLGLWVRNHMRPGNLAASARITPPPDQARVGTSGRTASGQSGGGVTGRALSRFFRDMGEEGVGMVLVSLADHYTYLARSQWGKGKDPVEKISQRLLSSYFEERSKILPARLVNGHDLMRKLKLKPGPLIGQLLEDIQDAQAEGKVLTKEEAVAFAKRRVGAHRCAP